MYHLISLGNRNYFYAFYCVPPELAMHQLLVPLVGPKSGTNKDPTACLQMRSQPRTNQMFPK